MKSVHNWKQIKKQRKTPINPFKRSGNFLLRLGKRYFTDGSIPLDDQDMTGFHFLNFRYMNIESGLNAKELAKSAWQDVENTVIEAVGRSFSDRRKRLLENNKLSEEYFMKPSGKKKITNKLKTAISNKSLRKNKNIDEYLSNSRLINNQNNGGVSPHGNTFIGIKKSGIKSPAKMKV